MTGILPAALARVVAAVLLAAAVAVPATLVGFPGVAGAHTAFESSDPADGDVLDGPVDTVTIVFTNPAEPSGEGFEVLDPEGNRREPDDVGSGDGRSWVLRFDEPLAGGVVGVRWEVRAGDAHPIDGSFTFTAGAVPTTPPTTAVPTDDATADGVPADGSAADSAPVDGAAADAAPTASAAGAPPADDEPLPSEDLAEFLEEDDGASASEIVATLGRILGLLGAVFGLGAAVFAARVLRGDRGEVRTVLGWVRRGAVVLGAGAVVEFVGTAAGESDAVGDLATSSFGLAVALRLLGAIALGMGATAGSASTAGRGKPTFWTPTPAAVAGAVLVLASFLFDGHTVTEGNRIVTAIVDVVHVAAAAVWAGGVAMMAVVVRGRRRTARSAGPAAGEPATADPATADPVAADSSATAQGGGTTGVVTVSRTRAGPAGTTALAARFSVVATWALVAVSLAGLALSVTILDSPSELWSTAWGRWLLVKVALVGVAAASGAFNHYVMVPRLEDHPDDRTLRRTFAKVLAAEAVVLACVVVATAFLVGASTT